MLSKRPKASSPEWQRKSLGAKKYLTIPCRSIIFFQCKKVERQRLSQKEQLDCVTKAADVREWLDSGDRRQTRQRLSLNKETFENHTGKTNKQMWLGQLWILVTWHWEDGLMDEWMDAHFNFWSINPTQGCFWLNGLELKWSPASKTAAVVSQKVPPKVT